MRSWFDPTGGRISRSASDATFSPDVALSSWRRIPEATLSKAEVGHLDVRLRSITDPVLILGHQAEVQAVLRRGRHRLRETRGRGTRGNQVR